MVLVFNIQDQGEVNDACLLTIDMNLVLPLLGRNWAIRGRLCGTWDHQLPTVILRVMIGHCLISLNVVHLCQNKPSYGGPNLSPFVFISLYRFCLFFIVLVISLAQTPNLLCKTSYVESSGLTSLVFVVRSPTLTILV